MKGPYLLVLCLVSGLRAHGVPPTSSDDSSSSQSVLGDPTGPCPDYSSYAYEKHEPLSKGRFKLAYQRPAPRCRKFPLAEVEETIAAMKRTIRDPDLFRLFENCFPNTLDTAIAWKGLADKANGTDEDQEVPPSPEPSSSHTTTTNPPPSSPTSPRATSMPCGSATAPTNSRPTALSSAPTPPPPPSPPSSVAPLTSNPGTFFPPLTATPSTPPPNLPSSPPLPSPSPPPPPTSLVCNTRPSTPSFLSPEDMARAPQALSPRGRTTPIRLS